MIFAGVYTASARLLFFKLFVFGGLTLVGGFFTISLNSANSSQCVATAPDLNWTFMVQCKQLHPSRPFSSGSEQQLAAGVLAGVPCPSPVICSLPASHRTLCLCHGDIRRLSCTNLQSAFIPFCPSVPIPSLRQMHNWLGFTEVFNLCHEQTNARSSRYGY